MKDGALSECSVPVLLCVFPDQRKEVCVAVRLPRKHYVLYKSSVMAFLYQEWLIIALKVRQTVREETYFPVALDGKS